MPIEENIRAEDITVELSLDGKVRELRLTTVLTLFLAEVVDNPTFRENLRQAIKDLPPVGLEKEEQVN